MDHSKDSKVEGKPVEETPEQKVEAKAVAVEGGEGAEGPSKNALKKQKKLEEKQKKAEEKQVLKDQNPDKPKAKEEKNEEEEMDSEKYYDFRVAQIKALKNDKEFFPFPHKFKVGLTLKQLRDEWVPRCTEKGLFHDELVSIAGRVRSVRSAGKSLIFYDLSSDDGKVQVMGNASLYGDAAHFEKIKTIIKRGDTIGVVGKVGLSKSGEFSVAPVSLQLLSPCLHMLPKGENPLTDLEVRYRQRYLDLLVNPKPREIFKTRAKVISTMREEFGKRGFLEVETPYLNVIAGGANARPFETKHIELDMKMFMRIAPELYLKMCVVGGIDRVYEIGKNFRNEGIDKTHNPEFTSCELYWAYADYNDLMEFTEEVVCAIVEKTVGSNKITVRVDESGKTTEVDFSRPWKRISIMEEIGRILKVDIPTDLESEETNKFFDELCVKNKVDCSKPRTTARLIDKIVGEFIEPHLINPTFLTEHPQLMCPLAKYHRSKPGLTERFELFISCKEFANAYTELNDPFVQREQFEAQMKNKNQGDVEAQEIDEEFIRALEHGLPPTGGWGLGIDRLVMLLTDSINIQEVILFPTMRPIKAPKSEDHKPCSRKASEAKCEAKQQCAKKAECPEKSA